MKLLMTMILGLTFSTGAFADQDISYSYKKVNSKSAIVDIDTHTEDTTQAIFFIDSEHNNKFLAELMEDKNSEIYKIKKEIEQEMCGDEGSADAVELNDCGEVELTEYVQTSFGRGGWASAGAGYTLFMGFRHRGTGRFFESSHMIHFSESVEAVGYDGEDFKGRYIKTLNLDSIKKL